MVGSSRSGFAAPAAISWIALAGVAILGAGSAATVLQTQAPGGLVSSEATAAFEKLDQAFVDAYAKKDATAIGLLFTEDAEFHNELGEVTSGREAISAIFRQVFQDAPEAIIEEIRIQKVRQITAGVVAEEGIVRTVHEQSAEPVVSRYLALLVKGADGNWRFNTLKDYPQEDEFPQGPDELTRLEWMLGDWVSEDTDMKVHTTCKWSDDGHYLIRDYEIQMAGERLQHGLQRIGWDPLRQHIRSWVFDSDGGYVEGIWRQSGDQWIVTQDGYNPEGEPASGVVVYTVHDPERVTWHFRSLVTGSEVHPEMPPVVMVRRPPGPAEN